MKILYTSCVSSKKSFYKLFSEQQSMPGQQVQKYHRLLMEGLVINKTTVTSLTALPINRNNCKKRLIKQLSEIENGIVFNYIPIFNFKYLKTVVVFLISFVRALSFFTKHKSSFLICDVLNVSVSSGALLASKLTRKSSVGIVTDLPEYLSYKKSPIKTKINKLLIKQFDAYVFLTSEMNEVINKKNKSPFIVIEGHTDKKMAKMNNILSNKYKKKVCIYAGGINKKYGIKNLTKAFIEANIKNSELHIYGNGDYEQELLALCRDSDFIKYFGVKTNDYILKELLKATILINPRPVTEDFTKYSFPSKNLEYMASGTPLVTTKLPGMPKEYYDKVYLIESDTIEGIKNTLIRVYKENSETLHQKGIAAKKFVLSKKDNVSQSRKIIEFLSDNGIT